MAKTSGLNVRCYVGGRDISGDANALDQLGYSDELQDITGLEDSAMRRQKGRTDGSVTINGWFDNATDKAHDALLSSGSLPSADVHVIIPLGVALGDACSMLTAKEANYDVNRAVGQAVAFSSQFQANDFGVEFGIMLTAAKETHASATNNSSIDDSAATSLGAQAQLQVFSLGSGTMNGVVQDSADDVSFAAITGLSFTGATARTTERLATSSTASIRRYVRFASTGTFTNAVLAVGFQRN